MKHRTLIIAVAAAIAALIAGATYVLRQTTVNTSAERIYLPQGSTFAALQDTLCAHGILRDTTLFALEAQAIGLADNPKVGSYVVQPHTRCLHLVQKLHRGQQDPVRLTIGRCRTPQQLGAQLSRQLMADTFLYTPDTFALFHPNTYEVYWTITPSHLASRMAREDAAFWRSRNVGDSVTVCGITLGRNQVVTLASIVEEETNHTPEKANIASVYLNRLRIGMPLQADPTVKYAVGDFTLRRILNTHLATPSPYNTYLHTGLPPTPICLPSAASIDAVLHANTTNYLYFCASPALDGTHRFATTLQQHNANATQYRTAITRLGIR